MSVEQVLLEVARTSILNSFDSSFVLNEKSFLNKYAVFSEQRACFVTLTLNGKLRGCIGSLIAHRSLFTDVVENAKKAAFSDPRFAPLSFEEFKRVKIELSVLTPATKLEYKNKNDLKEKIEMGTHGVIMQYENKRATYLPQVWEQISTFEDFFDSLSKKAGFEACILDKHPEIYLYKAIKIK